jgi:DNA adenine methylase
MAGLTTAAEGLCHHVVLGEIDEDVAAVWHLIFHAPRSDVDWLCRQIRGFEVNLATVKEVLDTPPSSLRTRAFRTIVKNRMQRGGIMAPGAGLVKEGEAGKGLRSRWYPDTLARRIEALFQLRGKITFEEKDAFEMILAGASGVSIGTASFGNPTAIMSIQSELKQMLIDRGFKSLKDAVGYAHRGEEVASE